MTNLLADLQAAPEGSRDLSDRVLLACDWIDPGGAHYGMWHGPDDQRFRPGEQPDPTRNVQDALALVPEDRGYDLFVDVSGKAVATIYNDEKGNGATGNTLALALCIAIIKTKEQSDG